MVAALGLLAGVCGRAFTVSGKGLNLYLILVARSGVGKEAMHCGVAKLIDLAEPVVITEALRDPADVTPSTSRKPRCSEPAFVIE